MKEDEYIINDMGMNAEKPLIVIEESPEVIPGQGSGEVPVITIEESSDLPVKQPQKPRRVFPWVIISVAITTLLALLALVGWRYYRTYINIGIPVSVRSEENILKLQRPIDQHIRPAVVLTHDSILGVSLNLYELEGLKAEVSFTKPDTTDRDVFLYSRCADFTSYDPKENHYLGSLIVEGKELSSNVSRLGYCAMANGNVVIGVARDERVKDYCTEHGGSFFRQFILVSDGELPKRFYLHGKVERRGIGRIGNHLYYIETLHPETMWDFADALREYGFIDAIYITGGKEAVSYYRDDEGICHTLGDPAMADSVHNSHLIPWLVFRKR